MSLTLTTALTRLAAGYTGTSPFPAAATDAQRIARINEALERLYSDNSWRGMRVPYTLPASVSSVITVPATYMALVSIKEDATGTIIPIVSMEWEYQRGGPGPMDYTTYGDVVARDQGEQNDGTRKYWLTGEDATNDARVLTSIAKRKFVALTGTGTEYIWPGNLQVVKCACLALNAEDEGDVERYKALMSEALRVADQDAQEYQEGVRAQAQFGNEIGWLPNHH